MLHKLQLFVHVMYFFVINLSRAESLQHIGRFKHVTDKSQASD